ncbi:MAG: PAS domain-containing protein [Deltaproteobacteria bacterium]|nr:PAS domain-containing protein [Deltaproteobacteria bacterium]
MKEITSRNQKTSGPLAGSSTVSCKITSLSPEHCCTILESIGEAIVTIDLDRTITYFNPSAETLTGYTPRKAVGQKCFDVFRTNLCERKCPLDETVANGDPQRTPRTSMLNRTGGEKTVSISTYPLRSENGEVIGVVESFRASLNWSNSDDS